MKKKKRYIVLLIILVIYIFVMFYWLGYDNLKKEKVETTILVGNNTVWTYSGKKWLNIEKRASVEELDWKEFTVYIDGEKLGNYHLWHDDKWYLFTKDKKALNYDGTLLGIRSNNKIKVQPFDTEEIIDYTYVYQVLKENDLSPSSQYTVNTKSLVDIDGDGKTEEFYLISNVFALEFNPDIIFSIVFMVKDGKVFTLYNDIDKSRGMNGCKPYLNSFLDIDEDNQYEVILSCGRYSNQEPVNMLYKLTKEGFKILISNQ